MITSTAAAAAAAAAASTTTASRDAVATTDGRFGAARRRVQVIISALPAERCRKTRPTVALYQLLA